MKIAAISAGAILLGTTAGFAAGIERSTQSINILFEEGNYVETGLQVTKPEVSGKDLAIYGGRKTGNVADDFNVLTFAYKHQFTDRISGALIIEHPYGSDIVYEDVDPTSMTKGSAMLGGTKANVESAMISLIGRYKFNDSWGVHGGMRVSKASGDISLSGLAYGGLSGYRARMEDDTAAGWLLGGTWERPDIAARVALTYYSEIDHDFDTTETLNGIPVAMIPGFAPLAGDASKCHNPVDAGAGFPDRDRRRHAAVRSDPPHLLVGFHRDPGLVRRQRARRSGRSGRHQHLHPGRRAQVHRKLVGHRGLYL